MQNWTVAFVGGYLYEFVFGNTKEIKFVNEIYNLNDVSLMGMNMFINVQFII